MAFAVPNLSNVYNFTREQITDFKQQFDAYDQDGNGTVDLAEVKMVLEKCGVPMPEAQIAELIKEFDADGSGDLNFQEFVSMMLVLALVSRAGCGVGSGRASARGAGCGRARLCACCCVAGVTLLRPSTRRRHLAEATFRSSRSLATDATPLTTNPRLVTFFASSLAHAGTR